MKKIKKALEVIFVLLFFMILTAATIVFIVGAFKWASSVLNNTTPQVLEWICVSIIALIGGALGALWYLLDTDE